MEANLIPWSQVIELKHKRDEHLLQTIEHYQTLALSKDVAEPSRVEARKLAEQYQRIYLGLPHEL
jgi:hypothetical protein